MGFGRYDPHMLGDTSIVFESRENVLDVTIARCWVKAKVLSNTTKEDFRGQYGRKVTVADVVEN